MGLGGIHPIQLLIVLALVLLVFGGRGKISAMMADLASGVRSFRKGLKEEESLEKVLDVESEPIRRDCAPDDEDKS